VAALAAIDAGLHAAALVKYKISADQAAPWQR